MSSVVRLRMCMQNADVFCQSSGVYTECRIACCQSDGAYTDRMDLKKDIHISLSKCDRIATCIHT